MLVMFYQFIDVIHLLRCYTARYQARFGYLCNITLPRHILQQMIACYH